MKKLKYTQPKLEIVVIDLKISLQLDSFPPTMDNETSYHPIFKTKNLT